MSCRSSPSFLKFLIDDNFREEIRIPPAFTQEIRGFSTKWALKTDLFSRTWHVKIEQHGRYYHICKLAWPAFVKNHKLKFGDFLLFWYVGVSADDLSTFDVFLYSASGLPKGTRSPRPTLLEISDSDQEEAGTATPSVDSARTKRTTRETSRDPQPGRCMRSRTSKRAKSRDHVQVKEEEISDSEEEFKRGEDLKSSKAKVQTFRVIFKHSSILRMALPADLVKNIMLKNMKVLFLIDQSGRKWKIDLCPAKDGRIHMGRGWAAFRNDINLKEGEEYQFTFIENEQNMLLVQKVEEVIELL